MEITSGVQDRAAWVSVLRRLAEPVLAAAEGRQLRASLPVEPGRTDDRRPFAHLEAVGRLLAGLAPWLGLAEASLNPAEAAVTAGLWPKALAAVEALTDPASPDRIVWDRGGQPLVDMAFLGHALLRAPGMVEDLSTQARERLFDAFRASRAIVPGMNNWLLFSAMIEAALFRFTGDYDPAPVQRALERHEAWYKGDGAYGDGAWFHWDFYNSYVIQPMLLDVLETLRGQGGEWDALWPKVQARAVRYAAVQERLIGVDGSFPVLGRSICYRCGAFQHLAQMALRRELPTELKPAQVRGALTATIKRTLEAPGTFDDAGWLRIGLAGHQPSIAEHYISTGSLYLCATAFLPLGLPPSDPFWSDPPAKWTARQAWEGDDLPRDHAMHEG